MPSSSPAQAPVRSTLFASNGFGTLSQDAATAADWLGEGARELAEAPAWLALTPEDGALLGDGDTDAAHAATISITPATRKIRRVRFIVPSTVFQAAAATPGFSPTKAQTG
jgi:hypothetical protein